MRNGKDDKIYLVPARTSYSMSCMKSGESIPSPSAMCDRKVVPIKSSPDARTRTDIFRVQLTVVTVYRDGG